MSEREPAAPRSTEHDVAGTIGAKAGRKLRGRARRRHGLWLELGVFGLVGWAIAVPALAGVGLGLWLDRHVGGRVSWTLTLLLVGVGLGCVNAWYWVRRESRDER